ncbi:MAG TPA: hypothetical protein VNO30_00215 [Kofleriaceae bacterium]|nr:hypothetical protein [Kofleriaceae bacterium]
MGTKRRPYVLVAALALSATGCFGYNKSAKRWSYVGDTVLILGGGGAIAGDVLTREDPAPCMPGLMCTYEPPISGAIVAGAVLATAGLVGIILNATRPTVKSPSR